MKINVLAKHPGEPFRWIRIENTLEALQEAVGGYIETVTVAKNLVVICDEEGRLKGKPFCHHIFGVDFVGDIIIAGVRGDEFSDVPVTFREKMRNIPMERGIDTNVDHCVCCGAVIPEGRQVCPECEMRVANADINI